MNQADAFVKAFQRQLSGPCRIQRGNRLLLAVSGGADSTALLRCLADLALRRHWKLDVQVAHVNHRLRPEADTDEAFVHDLCLRLRLPFHACRLDPVTGPGNREAAWRRLRYARLGQVADTIAADALATAHHADDQLETLLMRLVRGCGLEGLGGLRSRRRLHELPCPLIRPMLFTDRAGVTAYLRGIGQSWREDTSNLDPARWRNRLRRDVLPVLRSLRPDAAMKTVSALHQVQEAARHIHRQVRRHKARLLQPAGDGWIMNLDDWLALDAPVRRALLRQALRRGGVPPDHLPRSLILKIERACTDPDRRDRLFPLSEGRVLRAGTGQLVLERVGTGQNREIG